MIEEILLNYLAGALSVPAYMETPAQPPETYVLLEKTGSGRTDYICQATVAVQSYAPTLYEAAVLNEQVKEAMGWAAALPDIVAVQLNSDYNFTDTAQKRYRYQAVFDITHY